MIRSKFFQNNLIILILMNAGNFFSYIFQLIVARNLTPEDYGLFNSLNSMGVLIATPIAVLPFVISKFTVKFCLEDFKKVRGLFHGSLKFFSILFVLFLILSMIATPFIKQYLKIDATAPILIILLQMSLCLFLPVTMGILQGLERFSGFGLAGSSLTFMRLLGGAVLVGLLGLGVNGALFSGFIGTLSSILIGMLLLKDIFKGERAPLPDGLLTDMAKFSIPVLLSSGAVAALGNLDLVLVRHYCSEQDAGFYATAAILGRIAFYLPSVLIMVLFPSAAKSYSNGDSGKSALTLSLGLTLFFGGSFALICSLWPELIITLLFGQEYKDAAYLFRIIAISMAMLAFVNVFFTYSLAKSSYGFLGILGPGVIGLLVGVSFFHENAFQISWVLFTTIGGILVGTLLWFFVKEKVWLVAGDVELATKND